MADRDAHEIAKGIRRLHLLPVALAAKAGDEGDLREACDQAEEAIAAAIQAERAQWRPIEEAPKDGTEIVLFARGDREYMAVGQWSDNTELPGTIAGWFWPFAIRPTHWQPLPTPPGETT